MSDNDIIVTTLKDGIPDVRIVRSHDTEYTTKYYTDSDTHAKLMRVEYHAKNGQVFTTDTIWYEMQKAFNELSVQAYENGTEVDFVIVH